MKLSHQNRVLMIMTTTARNAPLILTLTIAVILDKPIIYATIIIGMLIECPLLIALNIIINKQKPILNDKLAAQRRHVV